MGNGALHVGPATVSEFQALTNTTPIDKTAIRMSSSAEPQEARTLGHDRSSRQSTGADLYRECYRR